MATSAPGHNLIIAGEDSPGDALEIVENILRKRVEERLGQVGQTLPKADRSGFVLVTGDWPNLGYRPVPPAQDDPVTILQASDVPREVSLSFLHVQYSRSHDHMLNLRLGLC